MARTRDPEATRAAIMDAAEQVFLAKGLGNAVLSEIAQQAGVTKSLIHHHFSSKEGLWREVKLRRFSIYASAQLEMMATAPPSKQLLRDSMAYYFRFLKENPQLVRLMAWLFLEGDREGCAHIDEQLMTAGVAKLGEAQAAGEIRADLDPRFVLIIFIGIAQHWFQNAPHFMNKFDTNGLPEDHDEAFLDNAMKVFFEGVTPR